MYLKVNFGVPETRTWRSQICHVRSTERNYLFRPPFAKLFYAICGKESSSAQTKFSLPITTGSAQENLNTDYFQLKN